VRGQLRVYLGAAPGVGKTYAMLNEGWRRRRRGTDVVVGFVESHGRAETAAQVRDLEVVARRKLRYRGSEFEEMDIDAVLARRPQVALVDELAHTNVPGSRNEKRWQDVHELLDAGIDVVTTVNVQHLESMNDVVESITGVRQRETIPDDVVRAAEQVELVDMTAEALRRRMAHGNIYGPEKIDDALGNYFRPGNLGALRELALLWVADRVDDALLRYRREQGIDQPWETRERVVVAITGAPSGEHLIRRATRMAQRGHADLVGVHIRAGDGRRSPPNALLERHRSLLEELGGTYHEITADDIGPALVQFARQENATQLVLGASRRTRLAELTAGSVINQVIRDSGPIDVHVISHDPADGTPPSGTTGDPASARTGLTRRRAAAGWAIAVAGPAAAALLLANTRGTLGQGSQFLVFLMVVFAAAATGGAAPAVTAALLGSVCINWFFTPPLYTWTIAEPENVLALIVFTVVGVAVGLLVTTLARRTVGARRASFEAEALARVAAGLVGAADPLPSMLDRIRTMLGLEAAAITEDGTMVARSGAEPDRPPDQRLPLDEATIELWGQLGDDDRRMLVVFTAQLSGLLERRRLSEAAAEAEALAATDRLRTAVLRAVSHDLRTPLASMKASATSLLQGDVDWTDEERKEFLTTIDEEIDRLDRLVANLLDASRLQAGALEPDVEAVAIDDVLPAAIASISDVPAPLQITVPEHLPLVRADPGLLERAVANVVANALAHSPVGAPVEIVASERSGWVDVRIIDHGPGVSPEQRAQMFEPFQRFADHGAGVGLGLSVARGMVDAMGGRLDVADTPGGGLTMSFSLPAAPDDD
jgi:two-component system, OmpR family, sensor histidine kinase KdpD